MKIGPRWTLAARLSGLIFLLLLCAQTGLYGWTSLLLSRTPATAALQAELNEAALLMTVVTLFLAVIAGILHSEAITAPLRLLQLAARRVREGDLALRLPEGGKDELGELLRAFDRMLVGLRDRELVKSIFAKYHGPEISRKILSEPPKLGGELKEAVVLFVDVRDFTRLSAAISPEEMVETLNAYFSSFLGIIHANHGIIDKFVGDAVLAVWGILEHADDDTLHAVECCLQLRQEMKRTNEIRRAEGKSVIQIGMGLDVGLVVAGNIGSQTRVEYTVIGDTVNTASRLQSLSKELQTDLLISETAWRRVARNFITRACPFMRLRGKDDPVRAYRVLGYQRENGQALIIPEMDSAA